MHAQLFSHRKHKRPVFKKCIRSLEASTLPDRIVSIWSLRLLEQAAKRYLSAVAWRGASMRDSSSTERTSMWYVFVSTCDLASWATPAEETEPGGCFSLSSSEVRACRRQGLFVYVCPSSIVYYRTCPTTYLPPRSRQLRLQSLSLVCVRRALLQVFLLVSRYAAVSCSATSSLVARLTLLVQVTCSNRDTGTACLPDPLDVTIYLLAHKRVSVFCLSLLLAETPMPQLSPTGSL